MAVLLTVVLMLGTASLVSAESTLYLTANATATYDDGGFYVKGPTDTVAAFGTNGITQSGNFRCLWAFVDSVADAKPYLKIKPADISGLQKITISNNWDVEPEIELELNATGESVFNLAELLDGQSSVGYTYVVLYVGTEEAAGTANFDYIMLSDTGAAASEPTQGTSSEGSAPQTGDSGYLLLLLTVTALGAVVMITMKKTAKAR